MRLTRETSCGVIGTSWSEGAVGFAAASGVAVAVGFVGGLNGDGPGLCGFARFASFRVALFAVAREALPAVARVALFIVGRDALFANARDAFPADASETLAALTGEFIAEATEALKTDMTEGLLPAEAFPAESLRGLSPTEAVSLKAVSLPAECLRSRKLCTAGCLVILGRVTRLLAFTKGSVKMTPPLSEVSSEVPVIA